MLASSIPEDQLGQNQVHLSCVDSTNNYAANILKTGEAVSGTVILAEEQTNGRGQRGAGWQSDPGMNLQFSAIWQPKSLSIADQRYLNFAVSIALVQYLQKKEIPAQIKWPNDILVDGKKICGVLIENNLRGDKIHASIIGIGLNVNQVDFRELSATSIKAEKGQFYPIQEVLDGVLNELNQLLTYLIENKYEALESLYFEHLFGFNVELQFEDMNGLFSGQIIGVDQQGSLQIRAEEQVKTYGLKEIKFLF